MGVQRRHRLGAAAFTALAAAAVLTTSSAAGTRGPARDLFAELYQRGRQQNGHLRTFTARFTETSSSSLLTRPLIAHGTVAVERPSKVALRYTEPDERVVIVDGDRMTVAWPARGVRQTRDIGAAQKRVQKYFVDSSPEELRRHFEIAASEAADGRGYAVTLLPKRKQIKEGLTRLDLVVDRTTLLLASMRMTFPNGDTKDMTFADVTPNAAIPPSIFSTPAVRR